MRAGVGSHYPALVPVRHLTLTYKVS